MKLPLNSDANSDIALPEEFRTLFELNYIDAVAVLEKRPNWRPSKNIDLTGLISTLNCIDQWLFIAKNCESYASRFIEPLQVEESYVTVQESNACVLLQFLQHFFENSINKHMFSSLEHLEHLCDCGSLAVVKRVIFLMSSLVEYGYCHRILEIPDQSSPFSSHPSFLSLFAEMVSGWDIPQVSLLSRLTSTASYDNNDLFGDADFPISSKQVVQADREEYFSLLRHASDSSAAGQSHHHCMYRIHSVASLSSPDDGLISLSLIHLLLMTCDSYADLLKFFASRGGLARDIITLVKDCNNQPAQVSRMVIDIIKRIMASAEMSETGKSTIIAQHVNIYHELALTKGQYSGGIISLLRTATSQASSSCDDNIDPTWIEDVFGLVYTCLHLRWSIDSLSDAGLMGMLLAIVQAPVRYHDGLVNVDIMTLGLLGEFLFSRSSSSQFDQLNGSVILINRLNSEWRHLKESGKSISSQVNVFWVELIYLLNRIFVDLFPLSCSHLLRSSSLLTDVLDMLGNYDLVQADVTSVSIVFIGDVINTDPTVMNLIWSSGLGDAVCDVIRHAGNRHVWTQFVTYLPHVLRSLAISQVGLERIIDSDVWGHVIQLLMNSNFSLSDLKSMKDDSNFSYGMKDLASHDVRIAEKLITESNVVLGQACVDLLSDPEASNPGLMTHELSTNKCSLMRQYLGIECVLQSLIGIVDCYHGTDLMDDLMLTLFSCLKVSFSPTLFTLCSLGACVNPDMSCLGVRGVTRGVLAVMKKIIDKTPLTVLKHTVIQIGDHMQSLASDCSRIKTNLCQDYKPYLVSEDVGQSIRNSIELSHNPFEFLLEICPRSPLSAENHNRPLTGVVYDLSFIVKSLMELDALTDILALCIKKCKPTDSNCPVFLSLNQDSTRTILNHLLTSVYPQVSAEVGRYRGSCLRNPCSVAKRSHPIYQLTATKSSGVAIYCKPTRSSAAFPDKIAYGQVFSSKERAFSSSEDCMYYKLIDCGYVRCKMTNSEVELLSVSTNDSPVVDESFTNERLAAFRKSNLKYSEVTVQRSVCLVLFHLHHSCRKLGHAISDVISKSQQRSARSDNSKTREFLSDVLIDMIQKLTPSYDVNNHPARPLVCGWDASHVFRSNYAAEMALNLLCSDPSRSVAQYQSDLLFRANSFDVLKRVMHCFRLCATTAMTDGEFKEMNLNEYDVPDPDDCEAGNKWNRWVSPFSSQFLIHLETASDQSMPNIHLAKKLIECVDCDRRLVARTGLPLFIDLVLSLFKVDAKRNSPKPFDGTELKIILFNSFFLVWCDPLLYTLPAPCIESLFKNVFDIASRLSDKNRLKSNRYDELKNYYELFVMSLVPVTVQFVKNGLLKAPKSKFCDNQKQTVSICVKLVKSLSGMFNQSFSIILCEMLLRECHKQVKLMNWDSADRCVHLVYSLISQDISIVSHQSTGIKDSFMKLISEFAAVLKQFPSARFVNDQWEQSTSSVPLIWHSWMSPTILLFSTLTQQTFASEISYKTDNLLRAAYELEEWPSENRDEKEESVSDFSPNEDSEKVLKNLSAEALKCMGKPSGSYVSREDKRSLACAHLCGFCLPDEYLVIAEDLCMQFLSCAHFSLYPNVPCSMTPSAGRSESVAYPPTNTLCHAFISLMNQLVSRQAFVKRFLLNDGLAFLLSMHPSCAFPDIEKSLIKLLLAVIYESEESGRSMQLNIQNLFYTYGKRRGPFHRLCILQDEFYQLCSGMVQENEKTFLNVFENICGMVKSDRSSREYVCLKENESKEHPNLPVKETSSYRIGSLLIGYFFKMWTDMENVRQSTHIKMPYVAKLWNNDVQRVPTLLRPNEIVEILNELCASCFGIATVIHKWFVLQSDDVVSRSVSMLQCSGLISMIVSRGHLSHALTDDKLHHPSFFTFLLHGLIVEVPSDAATQELEKLAVILCSKKGDGSRRTVLELKRCLTSINLGPYTSEDDLKVIGAWVKIVRCAVTAKTLPLQSSRPIIVPVDEIVHSLIDYNVHLTIAKLIEDISLSSDKLLEISLSLTDILQILCDKGREWLIKKYLSISDSIEPKQIEREHSVNSSLSLEPNAASVEEYADTLGGNRSGAVQPHDASEDDDDDDMPLVMSEQKIDLEQASRDSSSHNDDEEEDTTPDDDEDDGDGIHLDIDILHNEDDHMPSNGRAMSDAAEVDVEPSNAGETDFQDEVQHLDTIRDLLDNDVVMGGSATEKDVTNDESYHPLLCSSDDSVDSDNEVDDDNEENDDDDDEASSDVSSDVYSDSDSDELDICLTIAEPINASEPSPRVHSPALVLHSPIPLSVLDFVATVVSDAPSPVSDSSHSEEDPDEELHRYHEEEESDEEEDDDDEEEEDDDGFGIQEDGKNASEDMEEPVFANEPTHDSYRALSRISSRLGPVNDFLFGASRRPLLGYGGSRARLLQDRTVTNRDEDSMTVDIPVETAIADVESSNQADARQLHTHWPPLDNYESMGILGRRRRVAASNRPSRSAPSYADFGDPLRLMNNLLGNQSSQTANQEDDVESNIFRIPGLSGGMIANELRESIGTLLFSGRREDEDDIEVDDVLLRSDPVQPITDSYVGPEPAISHPYMSEAGYEPPMSMDFESRSANVSSRIIATLNRLVRMEVEESNAQPSVPEPLVVPWVETAAQTRTPVQLSVPMVIDNADPPAQEVSMPVAPSVSQTVAVTIAELMESTGFDREVLSNMPEDILLELLLEERHDRDAERVAAVEPTQAVPAMVAEEMTSIDLLASVTRETRNDILRTCSDEFLVSLPLDVQQEAANLRRSDSFATFLRFVPYVRQNRSSFGGPEFRTASLTEQKSCDEVIVVKGYPKVIPISRTVLVSLLKILCVPKLITQHRPIFRGFSMLCLFENVCHDVLKVIVSVLLDHDKTFLHVIGNWPAVGMIGNDIVDSSVPVIGVKRKRRASSTDGNDSLEKRNLLLAAKEYCFSGSRPANVTRRLLILLHYTLDRAIPATYLEFFKRYPNPAVGDLEDEDDFSDRKRSKTERSSQFSSISDDTCLLDQIILLGKNPAVNSDHSTLLSWFKLLVMLFNTLSKYHKNAISEMEETKMMYSEDCRQLSSSTAIDIERHRVWRSYGTLLKSITTCNITDAITFKSHDLLHVCPVIPQLTQESAAVILRVCSSETAYHSLLREDASKLLSIITCTSSNCSFVFKEAFKVIHELIIECSNDLCQVEDYLSNLYLRYGMVTSPSVLASVVLPSSSSDARLLRIVTALFQSREADGLMKSQFRHLSTVNLWNSLLTCMETIRNISGMSQTGDQSLSGDHGRTDENVMLSAVSGLSSRFVPLIEVLFCLSLHISVLSAKESESLFERNTSLISRTISRPADNHGNDHGSRVASNVPGQKYRAGSEYWSRNLKLAHDVNSMSLTRFVTENSGILHSILSQSPTLLDTSMSLLIKVPKLRSFLHFDDKRSYFRGQMKKLKQSNRGAPMLRVNVTRERIFEDSFRILRGKSPEELRGKLHVSFIDEDALDAGGVTREWFATLCRLMFNPDYALFIDSRDGSTFQPNPLSFINTDHLLYFNFVGKIVGKAISDEVLIDAHFTKPFYKHILGMAVELEDVEAVDPEYYKSLMQILTCELSALGLDLTFSAEKDEFGRVEVVDLILDGRDILVTDENKREYVSKVCHHRMTIAIEKQIEAFLDGLHSLVPAELISIFTPKEVELLISGLPDIDLDDMRANTDFIGYHSSDVEMIWFWNVLYSLSREEKALFLQFVTGSSRVPLDGFKSLPGMHGLQKFNIHKVQDARHLLPTAHTCFNQLDLPVYGSEEEVRQKLLIAIRSGSEGFGFI